MKLAPFSGLADCAACGKPLDTDPWRIVGHAVVLYSTEAMVPLVLLHPWCPLGKEPA